MIGEHTVADAAEIRTNVQIYGLFDLLGLQASTFRRRPRASTAAASSQ